jgi:hypothetical protein
MLSRNILLGLAIWLTAIGSARACESFFSTDLNPSAQYSSKDLAAFVTKEFRPHLKNTSTSDRFIVVMTYKCNGQPAATKQAKLTIQKSNYYIMDLNGIPLQCGEENVPADVKQCGALNYNYVSYTRVPWKLSTSVIDDQVKHAAAYTSITQFSGAPLDPSSKGLHDIVRTFALVLAESARFEEVLAKVARIGEGCSQNFEEFWPIVHNWGTISHTVVKQKMPLPAGTLTGSFGLVAPITVEMRTFFNADIAKHPGDHHPIPKTGKDMPVPDLPNVCT